MCQIVMYIVLLGNVEKLCVIADMNNFLNFVIARAYSLYYISVLVHRATAWGGGGCSLDYTIEIGSTVNIIMVHFFMFKVLVCCGTLVF